MADNLINVFDPDTQQVGSIPAHQLPQALEQGFEHATNEQVNAFVSNQKYGSTGQQLLTGLEGAAETATFGGSTALEKAAGVRSADIQGRREENPVSHGLGQVAGLAGSSLLAPGGGAAGVLEAAGEAGAKALIPAAQETYGAASALKAAQQAGEGVEAAKAAYEAAKASQPFIAKIGTEAADQAIQFGLMQSGDEVSKMFSGAPGYEDPGTATQTALTNIGLSSVLGGAVGTGFGVLSPLWKATIGQKSENFLNSLRNRVNGESLPMTKGLSDAMEEAGISAESKAGLSDNPMAAEHYKTLIESGTEPGLALRQTIEGDKQRAGDQLKNIFQTEENLSAFDAGERAKDVFLKKAEELNAPIKEKYAANSASNEAIQIPDKERLKFYDKLIEDGQSFGSKGSASEGLFKNYAERILAQDTVAQQDKLMTEIGSDWSSARRSGDFEKARALGDIRSSIRDFQDQQIEKAVLQSAGEDPMALSAAKQYVSGRVEARKMYSEFIDTLGEMAGVGKLGKVKSFGQFQEALEKIPSAKLADKLFDKKNIEGLRLLKEKFPEALDSLIQQKKSEILEGSIKGLDKSVTGGEFKHSTLLDKVAKLPKEIKEIMFTPEELSKIDNSSRLLKKLNERMNPSGTARTIDTLWKHMPAGVLGALSTITGHSAIGGILLGEAGRYLGKEAPDAVKLSLLKFLGSSGPVDGTAWKAAFDFINQAYKGQKLIDTTAKNIFKPGIEVLAREKYPNDNDRIKLEKRIQELGKNQEKLMDIGGKTSQYLPNHGSSLAQTSANAVNYLNNLKPKMEKKAPLDAEPVENPVQKSNYNRALDIAEQPLILMKSIKEGSITAQDISHLNALYPSLYNQLKNNLMDKMTDAVQHEEVIPYKTKLGLSLFMGQPLDSTMTPQALTSLNMLPASKPQQPRPSSMGQMKFTQDALSPEQRREAKRLK